MPNGTVNGKPLATNNHEHHQQPELEPQEQVNDRMQALAVNLAQTYEELSRLLERNPGMKRQMTEGDAREDKIYQRLKQRLKMADMAPRCQWVKQDGTACRSPQMKQHIYCCPHANGRSEGADADASGGGRRERDPGGADANTKSAD